MLTANINYPPVSVVILTYNGARYVEGLLESLTHQSYPKEKIETIVIDNASVDHTVSIIRAKHPDVRCICLKQNIGFAAGNNLALKYAHHEFLVFLNQDTVCDRNWLIKLIDVMLTRKNIVACNSNIIHVKNYGSYPVFNPAQKTPFFYFDSSPYGYGQFKKAKNAPVMYTRLISGCAFAIRKAAVSEIGYLFDERLWMYAEDTDLALRIHNLGGYICAVEKSVVYHFHKDEIVLNPKGLKAAARAIMNRVFVFFKNMETFEFILFFPFLAVGGTFKIFEFPLRGIKKWLYFFPFGIFSMGCMFLALFRLPRYAPQQRFMMRIRKESRFYLIRLILQRFSPAPKI